MMSPLSQPSRSSPLELNFDVDPCGKVQLHQRIDGFGGRLVNVNNSTMGSSLKMLPGVFVNVGRSQDTINFTTSRKGNRAHRRGIGALGRVHNFVTGRIEQAMVKGLQSNPDFLLG